MNAEDMVTGPSDDHESLDELFCETFALVDHVIEGITECQVDERLRRLLDVNGYGSGNDLSAGLIPSQDLAFSRFSSEFELWCARREAAEILAAARRNAEALISSAQVDAERIMRDADAYASDARIRAVGIEADAWEEANRILARARHVVAGSPKSIGVPRQARLLIAGSNKRSRRQVGRTCNIGNAHGISVQGVPSGTECGSGMNLQKRNVDTRHGLTAMASKAGHVYVGVPNKSEQVVQVGAVHLDALTEAGVVATVRHGWRDGQGGTIVTSNINVAQLAAQNRETARLIDEATLTLAEGMPLVWASRLQGQPLPERITGSSLVFSLSRAAAEDGRTIFLLADEPGIPEEAGRQLQCRYPALRIAGTDSPPRGLEPFDADATRIADTVAAAAPHLVLVGLGFPKQEQLIERLREVVPNAWYLGCGAGLEIAAGQCRPAPAILQHLGLEWAYRLALEPRKHAWRYLRYNLPYALRLLINATVSRRRVDGATICIQ